MPRGTARLGRAGNAVGAAPRRPPKSSRASATGQKWRRIAGWTRTAMISSAFTLRRLQQYSLIISLKFANAADSRTAMPWAINPAHRTTPATDNFPAAANNHALGQRASEALPDLDTEIEHSGYRYSTNQTRTHERLNPCGNLANSAEQTATRQTQQPVRPALVMQRHETLETGRPLFSGCQPLNFIPMKIDRSKQPRPSIRLTTNSTEPVGIEI